MNDAERFIEWAQSSGCEIEVWQDNEGSGYTCLYLTTPESGRFDVTITEPE